MLPATNDNNFEFADLPTRTCRLDANKNLINGYVNDIEAMKQAIYLALNVERYDHVIYSWNYGVELKNLFGRPIDYVLPEIKRRITEALMQDERITSVTDFNFDVRSESVLARFTVSTIFGDISIQKEVEV